MLYIDTLHSFFFFLGTSGGDLFKRVLEFPIFLIVTYMVFSEWLHTGKKEYKLLVFSFGLLSIQRFVTIMISAPQVFKVTPIEPSLIVSIFKGSTEIIALFFVAAAFAYPAIVQRSRYVIAFLKKKVFEIAFFCLLFSLMLMALHIYHEPYEPAEATDLLQVGSSATQICILLYFGWLLTFGSDKKIPYQYSVVSAFFVYAVSPALKLANIILYDGTNASIKVAAHPFPLLAVLLLTRVVYLKLVDKAFLKDKLKESHERYLREKEVSRLKDEFVSVVSHELRTPLTSMKLYISLLLNGKLGKIKPKQKNALKIINDENIRLNSLINNILDLSKLEAGKAELEKKPVNIHKIVSNELYLNMARDKGINVDINVPKNIIFEVDENKFTQVYVNLFNNAVKFTQRGGKITISAEDLQYSWKFEVADNGAGVPKEKIPHLFDKFYQADEFMTRKQGGTGLGLAIVKHIVNLHKGKITVDSEVGKGTKFTVDIPK
jgi:signal transduction histidine kinase